MGLETIALASLAVAAAGGVASYTQQRKASRNQQRAADEQQKVQNEQRAAQAQQAAAERRRQVREARVRRAQIIASAENTGTSGSSGAMGALSNISTNLGANIGVNVGSIAAAGRVSGFNQNALNFQSAAAQNQQNASLFGQVSNFGTSIFQQSGGFSTIFPNTFAKVKQ